MVPKKGFWTIPYCCTNTLAKKSSIILIPFHTLDIPIFGSNISTSQRPLQYLARKTRAHKALGSVKIRQPSLVRKAEFACRAERIFPLEVRDVAASPRIGDGFYGFHHRLPIWTCALFYPCHHKWFLEFLPFASNRSPSMLLWCWLEWSYLPEKGILISIPINDDRFFTEIGESGTSHSTG